MPHGAARAREWHRPPGNGNEPRLFFRNCSALPVGVCAAANWSLTDGFGNPFGKPARDGAQTGWKAATCRCGVNPPFPFVRLTPARAPAKGCALCWIPRPVIYLIGMLALTLGALMLLPMAMDLSRDDPNWRSFALSGFATAFVGGGLAGATPQ